MHTSPSSYTRWTWIVAIVLALLILWMLLTGRGPSATCCGPVDTAPPTTPSASVPSIAPPSTTPFTFNASANGFEATGDGDGVAWLSNTDALKDWLAQGQAFAVNGNATSVTLTGIVDSDAMKQEKAIEAQALFGSEVSIDNQLRVDAPEPVAVATPPDVAKLYFDIGKTNLPNDSAVTLEPIVQWLQTNPQAKAIISGFHDATGNKARNATIAKNRAKSTYEALIASGIEDTRIELRKPEQTEGDGNPDEARRVEVAVE